MGYYRSAFLYGVFAPLTLDTGAAPRIESAAMRNPLAVELRGYPVWGWLALLLIITITLYGFATRGPQPRCDPTGDCEDNF
jgi:hypothetical protein